MNRATVKEPIGAKATRIAVAANKAARTLEKQADHETETEPLRIYALRVTACGLRRKALLMQGYNATDVLAATRSVEIPEI